MAAGDKPRSPTATESGTAPGTRDATAAQAPTDAGTAAASQRLLQASTGGENKAPANDNTQIEPQSGQEDTRARFVTEFIGTASGARGDRQAPQANAGDRRSDAQTPSPATPEAFMQSLDSLERNLNTLAVPSTELVHTVRNQFQQLRDAGKLPQDLRAASDIINRLNENGARGSLSGESADTMLRMVSAHLNGKVAFVTPENVKDSVQRNVFNRENPEYMEGSTNCRACTASYIINEALSERSLMTEFDRVLEKVESGNITGAKINVPIENGLPRMTAYLFQMNHGDAHTGIAGQKYTQKEMREFDAESETVPEYIQRGLREAGFNEVSLPGGDAKPTRWPPREPGFYVLEHRTNNTSDSVSGHVTVAYADSRGKVYRLDTQHPDQRNIDWPVTQAYKLTIAEEAMETSAHVNGALRTRVLNPDSTMRDVLYGSDKKMTGLIDVDGQKYVKGADGKWKVQSGSESTTAPFKDVENLGTRDGFKFTFDKFTVTEKPNGTASVSLTNRSVMKDGKPLIVNGLEVKVADIISNVSRRADGTLILTYKDNTSSEIKPDTNQSKPTDIRNIKQLSKTLESLDASGGSTANGGTLDKAISDRIGADMAKGDSLETAVLKLVKPGVDSAGAERLSRIAVSLSEAGLPADATSIAQIDKVMLELRLNEQDVQKANSVVERARQHIAEGRQLSNKPITEKQALELAILENTPDPAKDGKNLPLRSAVKKLREIEEMREIMRKPQAMVSDCLATQSLMARDKDGMKDSSSKTKGPEVSRETNRAYALVKNPEALRAAEDMHLKIGGKEAGFTLYDASQIAQVPGLRDNPTLAAELFGRIPQIRSAVMADKGIGTASAYSPKDYLEMAKMLHADGKLGHKANDIRRVERDYSRRLSDEAHLQKLRSQADNTVVPDARSRTNSDVPAEASAPASASDSPAQPAQSNSSAVEVAPPVESSKVMSFKARASELDELPRDVKLVEYVKSARHAISSDVSRSNRLAFVTSPVSVTETDQLKPGESQLVVSKQGNALKVKAVESGQEPVIVTEDGTRLALKDCKIEIRIGQGSTSEQAACEALVRTHELKNIMDGKLNEPARQHAESNAIRALYHKTDGATIEGSGQHVAARVVSLGAYEFQNQRVDVSLSDRGVRFGAKTEIPYDVLVRDTLRNKQSHRDQLQAEKLKTQDKELDGQIKVLNEQIADLEHLQRNLHRPETGAKLMEAITKHATPQEIERLKGEIAAGKGAAFKGTVMRAGTYSLVAAFVAGVLANGGSAEAGETPRYAPTTTSN